MHTRHRLTVKTHLPRIIQLKKTCFMSKKLQHIECEICELKSYAHIIDFSYLSMQMWFLDRLQA